MPSHLLASGAPERLAALRTALPATALAAVAVLEDGGFEAWCVGGFVRDALLGRPIHDVDVATNARWQEAQRLFAEAGCATHGEGGGPGPHTRGGGPTPQPNQSERGVRGGRKNKKKTRGEEY